MKVVTWLSSVPRWGQGSDPCRRPGKPRSGTSGTSSGFCRTRRTSHPVVIKCLKQCHKTPTAPLRLSSQRVGFEKLQWRCKVQKHPKVFALLFIHQIYRLAQTEAVNKQQRPGHDSWIPPTSRACLGSNWINWVCILKESIFKAPIRKYQARAAAKFWI